MLSSMNEDDAAYTALLTQLLSDSSSTRNARVHSWIEHQYDFAFSEQSDSHNPDSYPPATSRAPSPSPSSSLGAHRTFSIDRPDSPLLPRISSDRPVSPRSEPCPSYDTLFFPPPNTPTEVEDLEERERARALRFLVQEMANWKLQNASATTFSSVDKPLPAPPPSPTSSLPQSTSSRAMRSRSSSMRISRLPSFTSTLSSDQSQLQDLPPPPMPVSVIVHGEYQHDLVLREDPMMNPGLRSRADSFPRISYAQDNDLHLLAPYSDDKDSAYPSPTLSNFSHSRSRETLLTSPYGSSPASPTTTTFDSSVCAPENIALPASPVEEHSFFGESLPVTGHERVRSIGGSTVSASTAFPGSSSSTSLAGSPITNIFPASPTSSCFPNGTSVLPQHLRAPKLTEDSQSRWSVATTASLATSKVDPKTGSLLFPTSLPKGKKDKELRTPKKRTRFIKLISRLSPGRVDPSTSTSSTGDDVEYDSATESDNEDSKEKSKKKPISKKSSLASLRASFSISRTSFSSQRPGLASPLEEVPPLPVSSSRTSFNASRPSMTDVMASEVVPPVPKVSPSKIPSRANMATCHLPPIPQSASTITSFRTSSQVSIPESVISLNGNESTSRISLLSPLSKRTSWTSAADVEPVEPISSTSASETSNRSKSIFRLTAKSKNLRTPVRSGVPDKLPSSKLPKPAASLPSPTSPTSRIPAPTKFTPPAKLATVIAAQSQRLPPPPASPPASKLPTPPSRVAPLKLTPRAPLTIAVEKATPVNSPVPTTPIASRLPMPASAKGVPRTGTVKGFWRRQ